MSLISSAKPFYHQCLSMEIAWLCAFIHLSATDVAEIAESIHLKGCPHTFVYIVYLSCTASDLQPLSLTGFHVYHKITFWVPESCLLISIGLIVGAIMHSVHEEPPAVLSYNVFFLFMLPPIVLESGYFMPTRPFFENVGTVR